MLKYGGLFVTFRTRASSLRTKQSTFRYLHNVAVLDDNSINHFRKNAFTPEIPTVFTKSQFNDLPAITKWFTEEQNGTKSLNEKYMNQFSNTIVPLEIYSKKHGFARTSQTMSFFVQASKHEYCQQTSVYLAQASLSDLPVELQNDVPTPDLVIKSGKGDVYATSLWLGRAPTYTPLHRDPNPNLFVQLAGKKEVRLMPPQDGRKLFERVQAELNGSRSTAFRGEEMMHGREREMLEEAVWGSGNVDLDHDTLQHCELEAGDGLFIPKGWWHSIKSVDEGMIGSVGQAITINVGMELMLTVGELVVPLIIPISLT